MRRAFHEDRKFIMGIAVLLVVFFHTEFLLPSVITYIRRLGYIQVDVFMVLSGFGLYYSYHKTASLKEYYKKRMLRILPTYWCLACVFFIFQITRRSISALEIIGVFSATSLWIPDMSVFSWFAQLIIMVYLMSPMIIMLVDEMRNGYKFVLLCMLLILPFITNSRLMMAVVRVPSFVLGVVFAKCSETNRNSNIITGKQTLLSFVLGLALLGGIRVFFTSWLLSTTGTEYYLVFIPSILLVPGILWGISMINRILMKVNAGKRVSLLVSCLGEYTFEIYLFQSLLYMAVNEFLPVVSKNNMFLLMLAFIAILGGYLFGRFVSKPIQYGMIQLAGRKQHA